MAGEATQTEFMGYLTKFVITSQHHSRPNQTIWIHDPVNGIHNRHYVMESAKSKIRYHETATNILINVDRNRRAPIESRTIKQELLYKTTSIINIDNYYNRIVDARGYEGWLYKTNLLGTSTIKIWATLDEYEIIDPFRDIRKQIVIALSFFTWNQDWELP